MTQGLHEIAAQYDAILCDVWGVLHNGLEVCGEAMDALEKFRAQGGVVLLLSNAPRPGVYVEKMLARLGAHTPRWDGVLTSGDATREAVGSQKFGSRCWLLGPVRDEPVLTGLPVKQVPRAEAEFILCTGLFDEGDPLASYGEAFREAVERRLVMVCANPDLVVARGGALYPCAGALALAYEEMGGEVVYFGKPHRPVYEQAMERLAGLGGKEIAPERVLAVGDGLETDIAGARGFGLDALFVYGAGGVAQGEEVEGVRGALERLRW